VGTMDKKDKDRLVGALGGGGGSLVGIAFLNYLLYPSWWESIWGLNLAIGLIGAILCSMAICIQLKW
jgi:hypothetical protein